MVVIRDDDTESYDLLHPLSHTPTMLACMAERGLLRTLQGGCKVPIGVNTTFDEKSQQMRLYACVTSLDGQRHVFCEMELMVKNTMAADFLGTEAAAQILVDGGREILDEIRPEH